VRFKLVFYKAALKCQLRRILRLVGAGRLLMSWPLFAWVEVVHAVCCSLGFSVFFVGAGALLFHF
jgi:hypothetical protein